MRSRIDKVNDVDDIKTDLRALVDLLEQFRGELSDEQPSVDERIEYAYKSIDKAVTLWEDYEDTYKIHAETLANIRDELEAFRNLFWDQLYLDKNGSYMNVHDFFNEIISRSFIPYLSIHKRTYLNSIYENNKRNGVRTPLDRNGGVV